MSFRCLTARSYEGSVVVRTPLVLVLVLAVGCTSSQTLGIGSGCVSCRWSKLQLGAHKLLGTATKVSGRSSKWKSPGIKVKHKTYRTTRRGEIFNVVGDILCVLLGSSLREWQVVVVLDAPSALLVPPYT